MADVIDLSSSPEPEPQPRPVRAMRRKRSPLFLPEFDEHEVIELTDSSDEDAFSRKRRKTLSPAKSPLAGPSVVSQPRVGGDPARRATRKPGFGTPATPSTSQRSKVPIRRQSTGIEIWDGLPQLPTPPREPTPRLALSTFPDSHTPARDVTPPQPILPIHDIDNPIREPTPIRDPTPSRPPSPILVDEDSFEPEPDLHERHVAQVREVIPDVSPDYVFELLERYESAEDIVGAVLHALFEEPAYPKIMTNKGKGKAEDTQGTGGGGPANGGTDYSRTDRERTYGPGYQVLAIEQLCLDFPNVSHDHIRDRFIKHEEFYAPTHLFLLKEKSDDASQSVVSHGPVSAKGKGKAKAKSQMHDKEFEKERAWLLEKLKSDAADVDQKLAEEMNEQEYEDTGNGIECGCCFSDYPFDKMIQCPDAHLFCGSCVTTYASTRLGEQNPDLPCMDSSGCKMMFADSELRRILPAKLLELYERVRQRRDVEAAALEGLEECPFCEFRVVMDVDADVDKLFRCQNEDCGKVSCRKCKKEDHLPKSCDEVEEDKKLDGKHSVEEAMTRALMRNCPKCHKAFIKESGCNKMTCPYCRTLSCYVCRAVIHGYEHFNQNRGPPQASTSSSKCPLWDPVEQRHTDEVTAAAKKALEEYKLLHPDVKEDDIKVDLPPPPPPPPQPLLPAVPHALPGYPHQPLVPDHPALPVHGRPAHIHQVHLLQLQQQQAAARAQLPAPNMARMQAHMAQVQANLARLQAQQYQQLHLRAAAQYPVFAVPPQPLPQLPPAVAADAPAPYAPAPVRRSARKRKR